MKKAGSGGEEIDELENAAEEGKVSLISRRRKKDAEQKGTFEPANSVCECEDEECEADTHKTPTATDHRCICAFDRVTHDAWPCHPRRRIPLDREDETLFSCLNCEVRRDVECVGRTSEDVDPALCELFEEPPV
ncbi:unnamed protein product [Strongylus vulgaris]|uniref:Uncharacterized protein n=1 Tax=Strongylus vulgaris TaxID=40348 RepID=A0A3P7LKG6_STRVU|nr:unnamed protein product [Strongylus vulgaris]